MQRFQLPSPHHYVLPLVACAVAGGADSLSVYAEQHRRLVCLGGLGVDLESGYLQSALAAAQGLAHTDVYGETWNGRSGSRFRVQGGRWLVTPLDEPQGSPRTRLVLTPLYPWQDRISGGLRWLVGVGPASDPAGDLLKAYARYSPIPIRLNGRQLNLERQGHWKLLGTLNRPPLLLRPVTALRQVSVRREVPFAGYLGWGVGGGGALVVVDGLLYPLEVPGLPADFRAILWHSGLRRDLSLLKLVETEELAAFRETLGEILSELRS